MSLEQRLVAAFQAVGADIKQLQAQAAPSVFFRTEAITATVSGQTSFTVPGGYTPGAIFVSLNGAALAPADFTATNGTAVVLASGEGVMAGSVLLVHVLTAFEVADALPLGGTAADSSRLGGVLAADFYRLGNILGTVSQVGGVPTGAIIERGSNANGEYVRWADGTPICRSQAISTTLSTTSGSVFSNQGATPPTWTFPAVFSVPPQVYSIPGTNSTTWGSANAGETTTNAVLRIFASVSVGSTTVSGFAIGRWY